MPEVAQPEAYVMGIMTQKPAEMADSGSPHGGTAGSLAMAGGQRQSLNADPFNLRAEELALTACTQGLEVRRIWSEREMVCSFGGRHFPGTPDGMFETWDGTLTCVQVVRVPLTAELSVQGLQQTLAHTMLVKVVKSQQWLRASQVVPHDFIIFCWLPFSITSEVAQHAEELMQQVRQLDARFSLRLCVPAEPGALFPALFASNHDMEARRQRYGYSWSDVATYCPSEEASEEDEVRWDITWDWSGVAAADSLKTETEMEEGASSGEEGEWSELWGCQGGQARPEQPPTEPQGQQPQPQVAEGVGSDCRPSNSSATSTEFIWDDKG